MPRLKMMWWSTEMRYPQSEKNEAFRKRRPRAWELTHWENKVTINNKVILDFQFLKVRILESSDASVSNVFRFFHKFRIQFHCLLFHLFISSSISFDICSFSIPSIFFLFEQSSPSLFLFIIIIIIRAPETSSTSNQVLVCSKKSKNSIWDEETQTFPVFGQKEEAAVEEEEARDDGIEVEVEDDEDDDDDDENERKIIKSSNDYFLLSSFFCIHSIWEQRRPRIPTFWTTGNLANTLKWLSSFRRSLSTEILRRIRINKYNVTGSKTFQNYY